MTLNIGVNVVEVDGRAAPTITAAPVSVAGFLLRAERGVLDTPVALRGMNDYAARFGGATKGLYGAHAVRGFFDNGGADAYAVRVLDRVGSKPAEVVLPDLGGTTPILAITAGYRGRQDPGDWGNRLSVTVAENPRAVSALPAQVRGAKTGPFALVDQQTLEIHVAGASVTITFQAADFTTIGAATAAEVAAVIARQTLGVRTVTTPDGALLLVGPGSGPNAWLSVGGTAAAALGFAGTAHGGAAVAAGSALVALTATGGLAVGSAVRLESRGMVAAPGGMAAALPADAGMAVTVDDSGKPVQIAFTAADFAGGLDHITSKEVVAAVNRQAQGFSAALAPDGKLVLMSDSFGSGSSIAVQAGAGHDATGPLGLTHAEPVAGVSQPGTVEQVSESEKYMTWTGGDLPAAVPAQLTRLRSAEFDLVVDDQGREVERFESLSMQDGLPWSVGAVVNDQHAGSRFVIATDLKSPSGPVADMPAAGTYRVGSTTAGTDGDPPRDIDFIGDPAARTGLFAFDTVDIQLLACPDSDSPGVVTACLDYVEQRGDAMFVGSPPQGSDLEGTKEYAAPFRGRKVYGALYAPWISIVNPLDTDGRDPLLLVPPVGHILGMYARVAEARGVWKAPAGDEARLASALGVEFDMTDADHTDLVRNGGVNGVRAIPGSGVVVDASRTLSTDTRWLYVNVRRLFNHVKSSLRDGLRWVAQEPHSEDLRRRVRLNVVTPFLLGLWRQGAFGSDPPEEVFSVKCDAENNPPSEVNAGNFTVEVFFYPVKPAETILIVVGQQDSGAVAKDT
ncbi:phage tail sheath family protein [Streptomyces palmae]|uniref:Tail sheath protein C-terminal domain-containing protein n=1 Tax=Streptomyces palmae TaxID=1701085 RepID=A0A4Z0HBS3_9ACTN|nr:phage tail sheath C-terminal domain-containing protein [Streptomyces palmae]TGB13736.1 hypothetical protein E4099_09540 [Streptomyces palmae]